MSGMKEKTASHGGLWTVVVLSLFLTALVGSTVLLGMHQSAQRSAQGEEPAASPNPTAFPGVMINGTLYAPDTISVSETGKGMTVSELRAALSLLPDLERVELSEPDLTPEEQVALKRVFPSVEFLWPVDVFGHRVMSDVRSLSLAGRTDLTADSLRILRERAELLYALESVDLTGCGLAAKGKDRKYSLGPMVYLLGKTYEQQLGLESIVRPYLSRLRDQTGENASFSVVMGGRVVLLYREESFHLVRVAGRAGQERPLHAGANGKILGAWRSEDETKRWLMETPLNAFTERTITSPEELLREYEKIRKQGYAISDGELSEETIGIGAPVVDQAGNVIAAVSLGAPRMRMDSGEKRERYIFLVKETARELSEALKGKTTENA